MSYILEGLKKLEKNRQRISSQALFTPPKNAPPGRNKRKLQRYLILPAAVLLLLIAGGVYWWLSSTTFVQSAEKPRERLMTGAEPEHQPAPAVEPQHVTVQPEQRPPDPPLLEKQEDEAGTAQGKTGKKSFRRKAAPKADVNEESSHDEGAGPVKPGEKIVSYNQLPDGVKKSLPEIKVFMHYYSPEPGERFVQINEHTLHEGQSRPDGLKVLQITRQAAVLSYQGNRFQLQATEK